MSLNPCNAVEYAERGKDVSTDLAYIVRMRKTMLLEVKLDALSSHVVVKNDLNV